MTEERYLEIEHAAEFRHEFFDGEMFAMSAASIASIGVTLPLSRIYDSVVT